MTILAARVALASSNVAPATPAIIARSGRSPTWAPRCPTDARLAHGTSNKVAALDLLHNLATPRAAHCLTGVEQRLDLAFGAFFLVVTIETVLVLLAAHVRVDGLAPQTILAMTNRT